MELELKHRIIGLLVLIALLAIFLPMFFDHAAEHELAHQSISLKIPKKPEVFRMELAENKKPTLVSVNQKTKPVPQNTTQSSPAGTAWILQTGNFTKEKDAQAMLRKLQGNGFTAYVVQHRANKTNKAQAQYSVFVGPILSKDDAASVQNRLQKKFHINAFLKEYQP